MYDVYVRSAATPFIIYITNLTIDNPSGTYANYTALDITDTVNANTNYSINWTRNSSALPTGYTSFRNKWVNITNQSGSVSIDYIAWRWQNSESTGYNEAKFELWKYDGVNWTMLNDTPDTTNNILSLTDMDPASEYGILQNSTMPPGGGGGGGGGCTRDVILTISTDCSTNALVVNVSTAEGMPLAGRELWLSGGNLYGINLTTNEYGIATYTLPQAFLPVNYSVMFPRQGSYCSNEQQFTFLSCYPQCDSNNRCQEDEYCESGICKPVECICGYIQDHQCVPYECCSDSDCNETSRCLNNVCVLINYSIQIEDDNVSTGENFTLTVFEDGTPSEGTEVIVVYPNGTADTLTSDDNGRIILTAKDDGTYLFYIKKMPDVKTYAYAYTAGVYVPPEEKPPEGEGPLPEQPPVQKCCLFGVCYEFLWICWYWWAVLLVLAPLAYYLYRKYARGPGSGSGRGRS